MPNVSAAGSGSCARRPEIARYVPEESKYRQVEWGERVPYTRGVRLCAAAGGLILVLALGGACAKGKVPGAPVDATPVQQDAGLRQDLGLDAPLDAPEEDAPLDAPVDAPPDGTSDAPQDAAQDVAPEAAPQTDGPPECVDETGCDGDAGVHCFVARGMCYTPGTCSRNEECASGVCKLSILPPGFFCTCTVLALPPVPCRDYETCEPGFQLCQPSQ